MPPRSSLRLHPASKRARNRESTPIPTSNDVMRPLRSSNRGLKLQTQLPTPSTTHLEAPATRKRKRTPVMIESDEEFVPASEEEPESPFDEPGIRQEDWTPESPKVSRRRLPVRRTSLLRKELKVEEDTSHDEGLKRYPTRRRPTSPGSAPETPPNPPTRSTPLMDSSDDDVEPEKVETITFAEIITPPPSNRKRRKRTIIHFPIMTKQEQHRQRFNVLVQMEKDLFPVLTLRNPYIPIKQKYKGKYPLPADDAMNNLNAIVTSLSRQFRLHPSVQYCTIYHLLRVFASKPILRPDFKCSQSYVDEFPDHDDVSRCMVATGCFWAASKTIEDTEDIHAPELAKALNTALAPLATEEGEEFPEIVQKDLNSAERMVYDRLGWGLAQVNSVNPWSMLQELIAYVELEPTPQSGFANDDSDTSVHPSTLKSYQTFSHLDLPENSLLAVKLYQKAEHWLTWMVHDWKSVNQPPSHVAMACLILVCNGWSAPPLKKKTSLMPVKKKKTEAQAIIVDPDRDLPGWKDCGVQDLLHLWISRFQEVVPDEEAECICIKCSPQ